MAASDQNILDSIVAASELNYRYNAYETLSKIAWKWRKK